MARATIPSASGPSTIFGKMVTMSIFTTPAIPSGGSTTITRFAAVIDADADPLDHRDQQLPLRARDDQAAPFERPFDAGHAPDRAARRVLHFTPDQVVPVERATRQRRAAPTPAPSTPRRPAPRRRSSSRCRRRRRSAVPAGTAPTRSGASVLVPACSTHQRVPGGEALVRKVGLRVDDHLALVSVGPGDAADQQSDSTRPT